LKVRGFKTKKNEKKQVLQLKKRIFCTAGWSFGFAFQE
jgi:hypothetical protein